MKRKMLSVALSAILLVSMFSGFSVSAVNLGAEATVTLEKSLDVSTLEFDPEGGVANQVTVNYKIIPEPIHKDDITMPSIPKEVVIVIDKSGSMGWSVGGSYLDEDSSTDSRLDLLQNAAVSFIDNLSEQDNMSVGLVEYSTIASSYNGGSFVDLSNGTDKYYLKRHINEIEAGGGTNIGAAIYAAHTMLQNGNSNAKKYLVFMTDGEPTAVSMVNSSYSNYTVSYDYDEIIGAIYDTNGNRTNEISDLRLNANQIFSGIGTPNRVFANYMNEDTNPSADYKKYAEKSAINLSKVIRESDTDYHNYYISFSSVAARNKLSTLAVHAQATSKDASSGEGILSVYNEIADEIALDVYLENGLFTEIIPPEFDVISIPEGMSNVNNVLQQVFDKVPYTLNQTTGYYEAEPIEFSVTLEALQMGELILGADATSSFRYIDLNDAQVIKVFEPLTLTVEKESFKENTLTVLELQAGTSYELTHSILSTAFPKYDIELVQMPISAFNGSIEEVNGMFDIVYIGRKESYDDYTFTATKSFNTDVDITNRKAGDILEFVNSGQLLVIDSDIFSMRGTKLYNNFIGVRDSVSLHEVSSINSEFKENVKDWYEASNKQPDLILTSTPKAYDGSQSSYLPDHRIQFVYDAFSYGNSSMLTSLYLDVNGDGLYTGDELALTDSVSQSLQGLSAYINYEDSFNGLMPWKLVLTDTTTNTKAYETGFVAMKGDKTIVRVLNLVPKNSSIDFHSSAFKAALSTDEYEITVTKMHVDTFESNYPNEVEMTVGGESVMVPTELNGYYDMIIFGFGDSYNSKDITDPAVLSAIEEFIATNQSVMFTHDTMHYNDSNVTDGVTETSGYSTFWPTLTPTFKETIGMTDERTRSVQRPRKWIAWGTTTAYKQNEGLITMYPYVLDQVLPIAETHDQYWMIDLENENVVPWYNLNNGNVKYYPEAYYYTFTNGSITYSGTGHSNPVVREEQELFVNTMLKASRGANHAPVIQVEDIYDHMNILPSDEVIEFKLKITDVDVTDIDFETNIYYVTEADGEEVEELVLEKDDMVKGVLTDITLPKTFDELTTEFILRIEVIDPHGAKAVKDIPLSHVEEAMLKIDDDAEVGYLVGDTIDINYLVDIENDDETLKDLISNIVISTTLDTSYLQISSGDQDGFSRSGSVFTMTPKFDDSATEDIDETDTERLLTMEAKEKGNVVIPLEGTYDRRFTLEQEVPIVEDYYSEISFGIQEGMINVIVKDNLNRSVGDIEVELYDGDGVKVLKNPSVPSEQFITDTSSGSVIITGLVTDIYTVKLVNLPEEYDLGAATEVQVDLKYDTNPSDDIKTNDQDIEFIIDDTVPPVIEHKNADIGLIIRDAPGDANTLLSTIYVHFDGVGSPLDIVGVKRVGDIGDSMDEMSKAEFDASPGEVIALVADDSGTFEYREATNNPAHPDYLLKDPDTEQNIEWMHKFQINDNGIYAIQAVNKSGNSVIVLMKFNLFIDVLPDNL